MKSEYGFNVAYAACQLAARSDESGRVNMSERIASAAMGIAEAEECGVDWWQINYDDVVDKVSRMISDNTGEITDKLLDTIRRNAFEIVKDEVHQTSANQPAGGVL